MHPALPKEFDGVNAIKRAYTAFTEGKITRTGVMIHRVTPVVDRGEVLLTEEVMVQYRIIDSFVVFLCSFHCSRRIRVHLDGSVR